MIGQRENIGICVVQGGTLVKRRIPKSNEEEIIFKYVVRITIKNVNDKGASYLRNHTWLIGHHLTCLYLFDENELEAADERQGAGKAKKRD